MRPAPHERVFFREEYHSLGERAPVQILCGRDNENAWVYPEDYRLRQYPVGRDPNALVPPINNQVSVRKLRRVEGDEQETFIAAVREGKYRKAYQCLRNDPLIDPLGSRDHPTTFIVQEIQNQKRRRAMLDVLLVHGVTLDSSIDTRDCMGWTAMHHAMHHENLDAAEDMLDRGCKLTHFPKCAMRMDLAETAIRSGSFQALGWLAQKEIPLPAGKYISAIEKRYAKHDKNTYQSVANGTTLPALHQVAMGRFERADYFVALFQELSQQGWGSGVVDHNGLTALEVASRHGWHGARTGADYLLAQEQAHHLKYGLPEPKKQSVRRAL